MENNKYAYFNILRFIGAISIAILLHWNDHILPAIGQTNYLKSISELLFYISKNSYVFVEMFYLLSGFLFAKRYINKIQKRNGLSLKEFITKRYIRIFPLVIISSIIMYFLHLFYVSKLHVFFTCGSLKINRLFFDIIFGGIHTFGISIRPLNGPLWYIGPLFICYFLAYYLTKIKHFNNYIYIFPVIIAIFIITTGTNFFLLNIDVARGLLSFFTGVIMGTKKISNFYDNLSIKKKRIIKIIILLFFILLTYIISIGKYDIFIGKETDTIITYSLIIFPALIILLYDIKWLNKLASTKIFRYLGNISFSIYIWNFPIIITLTYLIKVGLLTYNSTLLFMLINVLIHLLIASLSYIIIEKRIIPKLFNN